MTINTEYDADLAAIMPELAKMRTVMKGSAFVKAGEQTYLKSPNQVDTKSTQATAAYEAYLDGAEFDEYTSQTEQSMIGKLDLDKFTPEVPSENLQYLIDDCDGDGSSLKDLAETLARNILQVKWHIAVADYRGLQSVESNKVSINAAQSIKERAIIKHYPRECVVKYSFANINGRNQLNFIMLREVHFQLNQETYEKDEYESFLILALDDFGNYYQQKVVKGEKENSLIEGERDYVIASGQSMRFIPLEIVSDSKITNSLPLQLGFLNPIADACLYRYRVSADYKEAMHKFVPTTDVFGMDADTVSEFEAINGRNYRAMGQTNIWPKPDITIQTSSSDGSLEPFESYDDRSKDKIRSMGGVIPEYSKGDVTATEAMLNSGEQNSVLVPLVNSIESSIKNLICYCAMFEGLVSQDDLMSCKEQIDFDMPQEFAESDVNVEKLEKLNNIRMSGGLTDEAYARQLIREGVETGSTDDVIIKLRESSPNLEV